MTVTRDLAKSGRHYYCKRHRSHFCPCTAALKGKQKSIADWDAAEERYRAKQEARRANAS